MNSPENISKNPSDTNSMDGVERYFFRASAEDFKKIPGSPIAYWAPKSVISAFSKGKFLDNLIFARIALATGNNGAFIRYWPEISIKNVGFGIRNNFDSVESKKKWFPCNKGGDFRKWYGNNDSVVNWLNNGEEIRSIMDPITGRVRSHNYNGEFGFQESVTWSALTSGNKIGFRYSRPGFMFVTPGSSAFKKKEDANLFEILSFLSSKITDYFLRLLSATMNIEVGNILRIPFVKPHDDVEAISKKAIGLSKQDWDSYETSWDFTTLPLLHRDHQHPTLEQNYADLRAQLQDTTLEMQRLEEENNRIFIEAYGLQDELTPDVPLEEITLTCNPRYRYGKGKNDDDYETLLRCDTVKELISYAVGCMMGRYSLNEPGLVYAHSGNQGFDPGRYRTFPADEDGILPVMDLDWFDDDATRRLSAFIQCIWPETHLDDNLSFIANCLSPRAAESPLDTIRRYLSTTFFKDHMKTYKKRPIYWLFSSGRQKAFTCMVYIHRYHPATLSRMRSHYVTPLQGKLAARMEFLEHEREAAGTPSAQTKIQKQMDLLKKKQVELNTFDDELRHYADMKIDLNLDDGVKINYAKFGNLLAERKAITGK